jgi:hypothetical protein
MRNDQVIFLQAAKSLEGGLTEALTLLNFAHAFASERAPIKNKKNQRNEDKAEAAGRAILSLVEAENPNQRKVGPPINPMSAQRRVWTAIEAILTKDGPKYYQDIYALVAKFHPDLSIKVIAANAQKTPNTVRKNGTWSLRKAA